MAKNTFVFKKYIFTSTEFILMFMINNNNEENINSNIINKNGFFYDVTVLK